MIGAALLLAAAAANTVSYDCTLDPPQNVSFKDGVAKSNAINFPQATAADWHLNVSIKRTGDGTVASVTSERDLFQLVGTHAAIETGPDAFAFVTVAGGGCMFSETGCMNMVHLVGTPTGQKIVILPAALASDSTAGTREPMTVVIEGRCTRVGATK